MSLNHRLKSAIVFVIALYASLAWSVCLPEVPPVNGESLRINGDAVMVVVHASSTFDARASSKRGVDEAIRFAKNNSIPVVYLQDDSPAEYYFAADCAPDYRIASQGGEVTFKVSTQHLYIVGGHLELCLSTALHDILFQWAQQPARNRTVTYLMDGIYSNGKLIDPGDPFFNDFAKFMDVVTYGRPGGEHWPKLTLLETMGVISSEANELEYIRQILPRWDTTFPANYRVEVQLNDSVRKVLRPATGWNPPTLRFHFIDSAINLSVFH
jgi:hypothetical protein